jgi:ABC-type polysaccharide/polyol phosphate transport system ATPase subunit
MNSTLSTDRPLDTSRTEEPVPGTGSNEEPIIELHGVSKIYNRNTTRTFLFNQVTKWIRRSERDLFYALRDVSLSIYPGESVAVIGSNGAGKSTLLSTVAKTLYPDKGTVSVRGRVAALLELGSGFHPDLTGRENIYLNAAFLGLNKKEVENKLQSILDFADIGEAIDGLLRTYSSGMAMRLAFAVAVHVDPQILILDEILAVGDKDFQVKCVNRIMDFKKAGKTLLFVSHGSAMLNVLCEKGMWLDHGKVVMYGKIEEVVAAYNSSDRIV